MPRSTSPCCNTTGRTTTLTMPLPGACWPVRSAGASALCGFNSPNTPARLEKAVTHSSCCPQASASVCILGGRHFPNCFSHHVWNGVPSSISDHGVDTFASNSNASYCGGPDDDIAVVTCAWWVLGTATFQVGPSMHHGRVADKRFFGGCWAQPPSNHEELKN